MQDQEISLRAAIAAALWLAGTFLVLADIFTKYEVGQLGLVTVGAAMVLNVRSFFCHMHRQMQDAFELGRDYERGESAVRSIR